MRRQLKQQALAFQELLLEMPESLTSAAGSFRPEVVMCIGSDVTPAEAALMNLEQVPIIIITDPVQESAAIELLAAGAEDYLLFGHLERLKNVVARSVNSYRSLPPQTASIGSCSREGRCPTGSSTRRPIRSST